MSRWPRLTRWMDARSSPIRVLDAAGRLVRTLELDLGGLPCAWHGARDCAECAGHKAKFKAKAARGRGEAAVAVRRGRGRPGRGRPRKVPA